MPTVREEACPQLYNARSLCTWEGRVRTPLCSALAGPVFSTLVLMECKLLKRGSDSKFKALAQEKQQIFNSERDLLPGMGEQMIKFRIFLTISSIFQEAYSSALPQKTP